MYCVENRVGVNCQLKYLIECTFIHYTGVRILASRVLLTKIYKHRNEFNAMYVSAGP